MTEWSIVGVLVVLVGFFGSICAPIIKLNSSITKLTESNRHLNDNISRLVQDMADQKQAAHESHKRLWDHNNEQDIRLQDHDKRITLLEHKEE